jgi:1-deoxy-D-xylulose-5-phosphate reductoisomerase
MKRIAILGSTGSIGRSTLKIVEAYPERFSVATLAAGRNIDLAFEQTVRWQPKLVSLATEELAEELRKRLKAAGISNVEVSFGEAGTVAVATHPEADFVVSAIVGVSGLKATYEAVKLGRPIGLANKECMVAAGELIQAEARARKVPILPIDSEHNAVHQCMRVGAHNEIERIWLTASGGPFLDTPKEQFEKITVAQALNHPTWKMGQRITIDSATLMNKGFEVIEAVRLFDVPPARVSVTVHPQSTVHSMVEYIDGSFLAQISVTDMRLPILYAMTYPERVASDLRFDATKLSHLEFRQPDMEKFPCLRLAYEAVEAGGAKTIALNAADEVAVAAFLAEKIPFTGIPATIARVLDETSPASAVSIEDVLAIDKESRRLASKMLGAA